MIKRQFNTLAGTRQWGYIHLPPDKTKKYPVVIFGHGNGETGNTEATVSKILVNGPQKFVNDGWNPDLIIVAIQHHSWSLPPDRIDYVLKNDPDIKAYGDPNKIMVTGLSAGGEEVVKFMRTYHDPLRHVYVVMSPASTVPSLPKPPYKVWGFVGNNDRTTGGALQALSNIKALYGGRLTIYPGGHGGWNTFYDPAYKEDGMNIYEWVFGSEPVIVPPKKLTHTINVYEDGSIEVIPQSA